MGQQIGHEPEPCSRRLVMSLVESSERGVCQVAEDRFVASPKYPAIWNGRFLEFGE
jgi:hypothetical protein